MKTKSFRISEEEWKLFIKAVEFNRKKMKELTKNTPINIKVCDSEFIRSVLVGWADDTIQTNSLFA